MVDRIDLRCTINMIDYGVLLEQDLSNYIKLYNSAKSWESQDFVNAVLVQVLRIEVVGY
jgi:hypothetical protein